MTEAANTLEHLEENEEALIAKLRQLLAGAHRANPEGSKMRGQHPNGHGCVWARVHFNKDLAVDMVTDVFQPGRTYDAIIRFSNGRVFDDTKPDAHGMAIKLLGVDGSRVMNEGERNTQDLVLADSPNFFAINVKHMLDFVIQTAPVAAGGGGKTAAELAATTHPHVATFTKHALASPLDMTYWSQTPYLVQSTAVKFVARPKHTIAGTAVTSGDPHFLRIAMRDQLSTKESVFFSLEAQTMLQDEGVEDATQIWKAESVALAEIEIPCQVFDTESQHAFCESLSFTPWHAHTSHRPLGGINRARKGIYLDSKMLREEMRHVSFREPAISDRNV